MRNDLAVGGRLHQPADPGRHLRRTVAGPPRPPPGRQLRRRGGGRRGVLRRPPRGRPGARGGGHGALAGPPGGRRPPAAGAPRRGQERPGARAPRPPSPRSSATSAPASWWWACCGARTPSRCSRPSTPAKARLVVACPPPSPAGAARRGVAEAASASGWRRGGRAGAPTPATCARRAGDRRRPVLVTGSLYVVGAARAALTRPGALNEPRALRQRRSWLPFPAHGPHPRDLQARRRRAGPGRRDHRPLRAQGSAPGGRRAAP